MKKQSLLALAMTLGLTSTAFAQGTTAFTYQGRLTDGTNAATGVYDLQFAVYDAASGGTLVAGPITNAAASVADGYFTVSLDFGAGVFTGPGRWLDLSVRTNGGGTFSPLNPRQALSPTPYALYSANAGSAATATTASSANSVAAANIVGTIPLAQLPAAVVTNNQSGVTLRGAFTGDGGGLTNLPAASLTGTLADSQLSTNIARLNIPNTTTQATAGVVLFSGFIIDTVITNHGAGYTTPPVVTITDTSGSNAVITATVVNGAVTSLTVENAGTRYSAATKLTIAPPPRNDTQTFSSANIFNGVNTFSNVGNTFAGSFTGNAGGLTNLNAGSMTGAGALPLSVLPSSVALLNSNQAFTGVNVFTNRLIVGSPPQWTDNFAVHPATDRGLGIRAGWLLPSVVIQAVNDNATANIPLEIRGNPTVFSWGNVGIGKLFPATALDVDGTITATSLQLSNNLYLPPTTASSGIIYSGGTTLMHSFGTNNFFAGTDAGNLTMTGSGNSAFGPAGPLSHNTTGSFNTANGQGALGFNTTGNNNTANGWFALLYSGTGNNNTAVGFQALWGNSAGNYNTANGANALVVNSTGSYNTANGAGALQSNTTAGANTASGYGSLFANTIGDFNTANGAYSLYSNNGYQNTAIGAYALYANTTGNNNTASGLGALASNTTGSYNAAHGWQALHDNTTGGYNTASGQSALHGNTTGSFNTADGQGALQSNTTGQDNTAIGRLALANNTNGFGNTALGSGAIANNTAGTGNTADGFHALTSNTVGNYNTAVAYDSLAFNTTGSYNTANGFRALFQNTSGTNNVGLGYYAGYNITTGSSNIDIGNMGLSTDTNIIRIGSGQAQAFIAGVINGNGGGLTNLNAANLTGTATLPVGVLPANVALLNSNQTFTGVKTFTTNVAIGVASTTERLEVAGADTVYSPGCSIRIRNTLDPIGGFIGNGWNALQLGMYNPSASQVGVIAAGAKRSFFGFDQNGKVGSLANNFSSPNYRNLLDDGSGNMSISGVITGNGSGLTNFSLTGPSAISPLNNVAAGYQALASDTSGFNNTAVGNQALYSNTNGSHNTAVGNQALYRNSTGILNTACGQGALYNNTTGYKNTASGGWALEKNTTGIQNTAVGDEALDRNTTGSNNTSCGQGGLYYNTIGNNNVACGQTALYRNTTGNNNTAIGYWALLQNTGGDNNIALGYEAGYNVTNGSDNIDIGNPGLATDTNVIRIGTSQTQAFIAGVITGDGSGLTNLNASQVGSGTIADARLSSNVALLNGTNTFTGPSTVAGTLTATNASNVITGAFTGSGAGLTNVPADAVTGGLTTNIVVLVPGGGTNTLSFVNGILRAIQ